MKVKHTHGPWHTMTGGFERNSNPNLIKIYATNNDLEYICDVRKDLLLQHSTQDHEANAYKYNLISEDEFKAKYEDKLKFNDYKVIVEGDLISVGCLGFNKANIRTFQKVYHKIRKNGVDITKAYNWIVKHEKELGL